MGPENREMEDGLVYPIYPNEDADPIELPLKKNLVNCEELSRESVLKHYGYSENDAAQAIGIWENDMEVLKRRFSIMHEAIKLRGAEGRKIRIIVDYDPDYPKVLIQASGLPTATLPHDMGNHEEKPEK